MQTGPPVRAESRNCTPAALRLQPPFASWLAIQGTPLYTIQRLLAGVERS